MSTIRTGMVYQRTVKGPNYVCLGKATIDGQTMVISVKNGNINKSGKSRKMKTDGVVVHAHAPEDIARVHQVRTVDVASVFSLGHATEDLQPVLKRMLTKGIETAAELPKLSELK